MRREVTIVQELLAHYRVPFYELLRSVLKERDIRLRLIHGQAIGKRASRADEARLAWAELVVNRHLPLLPSRPRGVWQPVTRAVRSSDLVIVEHANRQITNYALLARQRLFGDCEVAFWGHGANLQAVTSDSVGERFKRMTARLPAWWFAYTNGSARRVEATGFPGSRITVVNNSVDTSLYSTPRTKDPRLCVYVGSLHEHKRIDFLLSAAKYAAERLQGFRLVVVGGGEKQADVEEAARRHDWLEFRGPQFHREKADTLGEATLLLMPGLVGLVAVESFAARTPILTTDIPHHSPEYEYLASGRNSVVMPGDTTPTAYGGRIVELLMSPTITAELREGCSVSAKQYSLSQMVNNFATGIERALEHGS